MKTAERERRLLEVFLRDPLRKWYGFDLCEESGIRASRTYALLSRLERLGWVVSTWETISVDEQRRAYILTPDGEIAAREGKDAQRPADDTSQASY